MRKILYGPSGLAAALLMLGLFGCGGPAGPTGTTPSGQTGAPAAGGDLPASLVQDVEALIRLTGEYNALAAQVTSKETFIQHREELSRIDMELQNYIENVSIAEAKLSGGQKSRFHSEYYDTKAFPLMQEKSRHYQRIQQIVP